MEKEKLDPGNPEDWKKAQADLQEKFGHIFASSENPSEEAEVNFEKGVKSSKNRRGRGGAKKPTSAETKEKIRETARISKEKAEIKNYIDKILLGINFEPEFLNLSQEIIKRMNDLATKSVMEMDVENRKEQALHMIGEEINNKLQSLDEDSDEYKVLNTIRNSLEKNRGGDKSDPNNYLIGKIEKEIEFLKNEIEAGKNRLGIVEKGSKKEGKILEIIKLNEEKLEKLEAELELEKDILTGEDVEIVSDSIGMSGKIEKVKKKNGNSSKVHYGETFDVVLKNNPKKGESILFSQGYGIKNTSEVMNIKKCVDGSYIIETATSYYRLKIDGEDIKNEDNLGTEESPQSEFVKEEPETVANFENNEGDKFSMEEVYNRMKSAGAEDEDISYFFNLKKAERSEFLNATDEELTAKIEELKEARLQNDNREEILAQDEATERFLNVGASQEDIDYFYGNLTKEERLDIFNLDDEGLKNKIEELREERIKYADGFVDNFSPEEVEDRLEKLGIIEDERKYFARLGDEDRLDFLNSTDEELKLRIEKLREEGMKSANEKIIPLTQELNIAREEYLKKEEETGNAVAKLKNFFKSIVSDDKYEVEKELEGYRQRYEEALAEYTEVIMDAEGLNDQEEREIMYRYAKFGETLNLMSTKEDIKFQKHPAWEGLKRDFEFGGLNLIDKYKDLLGKSREFITEKTGSKILGIGGGAIAVGGAMSLLAGFVPGVRGIARTMGIAVATKGFYDKAQVEAILSKEEGIKEGFSKIENKYIYLDKEDVRINEDFKKELELLMKEVPESAQRERAAEVKRVLSSFGKAVLVNLAFYEAGKALKDSGFIEESVEMMKKYIPVEKISAMVGLVKSSDGTVVHSGPSYPPVEDGSVSKFSNVEVLGDVKEVSPQSPDPAMSIDNNDSKIGEENRISNNILETEKGPLGQGGIKIEETQKIEEFLNNGEAAIDEKAEVVESNVGQKMEGVALDNLSRGEVEIMQGKGIKDSLASVLAKNSENLTEGKMGWDPSKYKSVEEWANKRAIGIVAELKEKYPNYNFNKISAETKLLVDFSDKADVKIVGFEDAKHLGGKPEAISDLEKNIIKDAPIDKEAVFEKKAAVEINEIKPLNIESEVEKVRVEMNKANTLKEISVAHSLGFSPSDYAELNDISIKSLFELRDSGNIENPNVKLKNFFNFMIEKGQIEDMDKSISETVRGLSDQSLQNMTVGYKIVSPEEYNVYINGLMRGEFELGISERGARNVFVNLDKIKSDTIGNQTEDAIFKSFKGAVEKVGIKFSYNDGDSVKSYVMKAMIKAYESGAIGKLRGELVEIDSNIKK